MIVLPLALTLWLTATLAVPIPLDTDIASEIKIPQKGDQDYGNMVGGDFDNGYLFLLRLIRGKIRISYHKINRNNLNLHNIKPKKSNTTQSNPNHCNPNQANPNQANPNQSNPTQSNLTQANPTQASPPSQIQTKTSLNLQANPLRLLRSLQIRHRLINQQDPKSTTKAISMKILGLMISFLKDRIKNKSHCIR